MDSTNGPKPLEEIKEIISRFKTQKITIVKYNYMVDDTV